MTLPPYAIQVGDVVLPRPIAGHPALELCNTLAGWADPPEERNEWLRGYEVLAVWAVHHGLIATPPAPRPAVGARVLAEVRELRAALYALLRGPESDESFTLLAKRASEANALRRLTRSPDGSAVFGLPPADDARLPLHAVALATADLLGSKERRLVRACPGSGCGWLFLDSRGRRVWCTMAACGNRAKVRAHARRARGGDGLAGPE